MAYASVTVEGGMFPADLLDRIAAGDGEGQRIADFGLSAGRRLSDEIQATFSEVRSYWDALQYRLRRATASDSTTTLTRENWVLPLLQALGFDNIEFQRAAAVVGSESYNVSHRAGTSDNATVIHIVALDQKLYDRDGRRSPHALVQEYLNRSDAVWAIVTNGRQLRLLRDTARLAKPTYVEFDLESIVEANLYSEFVLLYRLLHKSRFPADGAAGNECLLDGYYVYGIDLGGKVRDKLRDGVVEALKVLGSGFLAHPDSTALRARFESGALDAPAYYRQLLRLVYRLLFLMAAEERRLVFPAQTPITSQAVYHKYYSVARLRDRCERRFSEDRYSDLWLGLRQTFELFREDSTAAKLGLHALNGELFGTGACADLETAGCANRHVLEAMFKLSTYLDDKVRRRVNYAFLDVEEFGSVYESLLDFHPRVTLTPPAFELVSGSDRKQTGSYYTPPELVRELIESALVPVVEERLAAARTKDAKIEALLALRVCDPAAGSGHFLLAAGRRIARELAKVRSEEAEPPPEEYRHALRDVIRHCLYAVDKNPLAVDLCKVALWIEGHNAGLPLSFLDNHVKCGDSLVGVFDLQVLVDGIPDDAYKPVTGDDRSAARGFRDLNKRDRTGQARLTAFDPSGLEKQLAPDFAALGDLEELTPDDVHTKEELYIRLRAGGTDWWRWRVACDLWTYAFFAPLNPQRLPGQQEVPTSSLVKEALAGNNQHVVAQAHAMAASLEHPFFHWPLEFPDVFAKGGFDVVVGNPPWERIKLQEEEFFAARAPAVSAAANKAQRQRLIDALQSKGDPVWDEFAAAKHEAEAESKFVRGSNRFTLTGVGDVNTYALFAEHCRCIIEAGGRLGVIIPSAIATDHTVRAFFQSVVEAGELVSLYEFENEGFFQSGQGHMNRFCLFVLTGGANIGIPDFLFQGKNLNELKDEERHFNLSQQDFVLLNPNTLTCPIFRSRRDAELTKSVYQRVPVLINEPVDSNPWGMTFQAMFHMSGDSHLFLSQPGPARLRLYESKMVQIFNHRYGDYATIPSGTSAHVLPRSSDDELSNPSFQTTSSYYVDGREVESRLADKWDRSWLLGWRRVTDSRASARTMIPAILPKVGAGDSIFLMFPLEAVGNQIAGLVANLSSFAFDYLTRQKLGGTNLLYYVVEQLPVLAPQAYESPAPWSRDESLGAWLTARVLELTYTAWELQAFASDLGYEGPPFRWDASRRFMARCELDSAFFHLYGLDRKDAAYMMDTFPVVHRAEDREHGEYRSKRVILEIYDEMAEGITTVRPYQTRLDPPPADRRVAHEALGMPEVRRG